MLPAESDSDATGPTQHQDQELLAPQPHHFSTVSPANAPNRLTIKLRLPTNSPQKPMTIEPNGARRTTRQSASQAAARNRSGSEYSAPATEPDSPEHEEYTSQRGRRTTVKSYKEESEDNFFFDDDDEEEHYTRRPSRQPKRSQPRRAGRLNGFIATDDDEPQVGYYTRSRSGHLPKKAPPPRPTRVSTRRVSSGSGSASTRSTAPRRLTRRSARELADLGDYVQQPDPEGDADAEGEFENEEDAPHTTPEPEPEPEEEEADAADDEPKTYSLRQRKKVDYVIPPLVEDFSREKPPAPTKGKGRPKPRIPSGLKWGASGAELGRLFGMPPEDSDSDYPTRTPRKPFGAATGAAGGGGSLFAPGQGLLAPDLAGTPSNLGKVGDAALADADPLGVNTNVTFDEVGGLDDHITALKEMTLLPLLYPELFQRFNVTPPRGVLFHGPPGTGKTLVARALAASCRSGGRNISFFMRKGADCLSKWVGEAERQLRLLFEEARNSQPSIIFFDEIDGLAPVRSSKQDQIHASIVSTLLALMDGMDGRGQVIVIGATNRPDAIDPALRRPGRFDREFYFPLPNFEARTRILSILTRGWDGWDGEKGDEARRNLAKITRGYGGADLRALCTEAALNAVQRRYPQIYKSNDRLLVKPETVGVEARDFMISVKKLVPSSARSTASTANPLPPQLVPLLAQPLEQVKTALSKAMPMPKKRNVLEEAEWEEDHEGGEAGAFQREMLLQAMETLRVHRPRILLHGPLGMGQSYVGAAALHHLEGFNVQSLDLGTLMGDSTRTVEAAIVQLFVEAKRHQPSIVYIPSLNAWCAAVSETARTTVRAMLDSLAPTDPVLLLALVDGPFASLPRDVRSWFGVSRENRIALQSPTADQRREFFAELVKNVARKPTEFPDAVKRKKRILEELPIAPPLAPRVPTAAELALQDEADARTKALLKYRLGPILTELKKKFKRFTKPAADEYGVDSDGEIGHAYIPRPAPVAEPVVEPAADPVPEAPAPNGIIDVESMDTSGGDPAPPLVNGDINGIHPDPTAAPIAPADPNAPPAVIMERVKMYNIDLEKIHKSLYYEKYLTPQEFLDDINKILHNAEVQPHDTERLYRAQHLQNTAQIHILDFDPHFRLECERMAVRERERRKAAKETEEAKEKEGAKTEDQPKEGENQSNATSGPLTRRSARNNGLAPEIALTDPLQLERKLKRQRSDASGSQNGSQAGSNASGGRSPKRVRRSASHEIEGDLSTAANDPNHMQSAPSTETADVTMQDESPNVVDTASVPLLSVHGPLYPAPIEAIEAAAPPTLPIPVPEEQLILPVSQPVDPPDVPMSSVPEALVPVQPNGPPTPIPRTPSPPPPDFHVDSDLLSKLENDLVTRTASLNVEQLEQLRATCLDCIWRRRSDWDRDELVKELVAVIAEFVEEVALDVEDHDSP